MGLWHLKEAVYWDCQITELVKALISTMTKDNKKLQVQ